MKLKTLKRFKDRLTGEVHEVGDVFDADKERARELLDDERELVKPYKAAPKKRAEKTD